ncbi:MAG: hypothetical protein ACI35P_15000 [Bacillus sp. (in: firmicutes)]
MNYRLDKELSQQVLTELGGKIAVKECYNNVANVAAYKPLKFQSGEWKICYGYMESVQNAWVRHGFILDTVSGKVIDPTIMLQDGRDPVYRVFKELDIYEFLRLLEKEDMYPDLYYSLQKEDVALQKELEDEGFFCVNVDVDR